MHSACRPASVAANTLSGHLARVSVGLVPATDAELTLPFSQAVMERILERVPRLRPDCDWVVLMPTDSRRARVMILGLDEQRSSTVLVRATLDEPNLLAMQLLGALADVATSFVYPRVDDVFSVDGWWITVEEPLPRLPHRPARLDIEGLHEVATAIQGLIPPRDGLVCAHGDLGPWNVRRYSGGLLGILDWEYAHWAPPAADEVWYALTRPLATTKAQGRRVGELALGDLRRVYGDDDIRTAARFIVSHRSGPEPREIREGVERSESLNRFEARLAAAFTVLTD